MFNPYFARPIGSRNFEQHLLTIATRNVTMTQEAMEMLRDTPGELRMEPHDPPNTDPLKRGWLYLDMAVKAYGLIDYLELWKRWLKTGKEMDRLRKNAREVLITENCDEEEIYVYQRLYTDVCQNWRDRTELDRIYRIDNAIRRIEMAVSRIVWGETKRRAADGGTSDG